MKLLKQGKSHFNNLPYKQLGLGLIGIGRPWGYHKVAPPTEKESIKLLEYAFMNGIRLYDTAASYGLSEKRLGSFLRNLSAHEREAISVATKFGDHWNANEGYAYVDHSYESLVKSLDRSMDYLRQIDLLQVHKPSLHVLNSQELLRAIEYAKRIGIKEIGISLSDVATGYAAYDLNEYDVIQLPYNCENPSFKNIIILSHQIPKHIIVNRPYNTGNLLYSDGKIPNIADMISAFKFINKVDFVGYILTGTTSIAHLDINIQAFDIATKEKSL